MKNKNLKRIICLAAVALVLVAGVAAKDAMAYFTAYIHTEGKETLSLGFTQTKLVESDNASGKIVVVENTGSADCYVRVLAFAPSSVKATVAGEGWTLNNGYYEYTSKLDAGAQSAPLQVSIDSETAEEFNVIVIQECTPVLYDANGNPYASWDASEFNITDR